jgi:hypothetical protein
LNYINEKTGKGDNGMLCVCGADCSSCPSFGRECAGCETLKGKVYWAEYDGKDVCPYYQCVKDKRLKHCGECSDIPCALWYSLKDPNMTDEQHEASIRERVEIFKRLNS